MTPSLLFLAAAVSGTFVDFDAVDRQVAAFTGIQMGQPGGATGPVDRRLKLQPCRAGLALSWRTTAHDTVVVQCGDAGGWRLFIPLVRAVTPPVSAAVITRGGAVSIAVSGEGFTVSQPGEALESGAVGAWIKVRPASGATNAQPMRARVERPGLVSLPLN